MSTQWAEPATHTLLRVDAGILLPSQAPAPAWVAASLHRAPWVVVRRAPSGRSLIPVGVRGEAREQRYAAWIGAHDIRGQRTPQALAAERGWRVYGGSQGRPALAALDAVESIMCSAGLAGRWGPTGSVGFELASHRATVREQSDLDLAIRLEQPLSCAAARGLEAALAPLPVRCDVLLEMPWGAVSLGELAQMPRRILLRTVHGPRLIDSGCAAVADG